MTSDHVPQGVRVRLVVDHNSRLPHLLRGEMIAETRDIASVEKPGYTFGTREKCRWAFPAAAHTSGACGEVRLLQRTTCVTRPAGGLETLKNSMRNRKISNFLLVSSILLGILICFCVGIGFLALRSRQFQSAIVAIFEPTVYGLVDIPGRNTPQPAPADIITTTMDASEIPPSATGAPNRSPTVESSNQTPLPADTPLPPDVDLILENVIGKLRPGMMVFNPPGRMKQAHIERIELRILSLKQELDTLAPPAQTLVVETFSGDLMGTGTAIVESLAVGTVMKARLSGENFEILALNEEEQIVAGDTYTEWAWDVKALKSGKQNLNLTITVKVIVDGFGEKARDIPVITRGVDVQVDPVHVLSTFVGENWKWLWTALLVPLAGWGWKYYSKEKRKKERTRTEGS
jgi:hypothetical protein